MSNLHVVIPSQREALVHGRKKLLLGLDPTRSMSESDTVGPVAELSDRSHSHTWPVLSNAKAAKARSPNASISSVLTIDELAAFASDIAKRLGFDEKKSRGEIESAVQALLKPDPSNLSIKNAVLESEAPYQCRFCPKRKNAQCELK